MNVGSDSLTVADALAQHYAAHGLPVDGGEGAPWFRVRIGPLTIRLPNPPARRRAVFFHDVNHILTGYNTVFSDGEMVIAGFHAFVRGRGCSSIYHRQEHRADLRMKTVGDLKRILALDRALGRADASDRVHFLAWAIAAWVVTLGATAAVLFVLWGVTVTVRPMVDALSRPDEHQ